MEAREGQEAELKRMKKTRMTRPLGVGAERKEGGLVTTRKKKKKLAELVHTARCEKAGRRAHCRDL